MHQIPGHTGTLSNGEQMHFHFNPEDRSGAFQNAANPAQRNKQPNIQVGKPTNQIALFMQSQPAEVMSLSSFMSAMGFMFIGVTLAVALLKKEDPLPPGEEPEGKP